LLKKKPGNGRLNNLNDSVLNVLSYLVMVQMIWYMFFGHRLSLFFNFVGSFIENTSRNVYSCSYAFFPFDPPFKRQHSVSLIYLKCHGLSKAFSDCWVSRYFEIFNQQPSTCVANFRSTFHTKPVEMCVAKDIA